MMDSFRHVSRWEDIRYQLCRYAVQLDAIGTPEYTLRHKRSNDERVEVQSSLYNRLMATRHSAKT